MESEFSRTTEAVNTVSAGVPGQTNRFVGYECALKTCCKKYKKGKRCKKCPN